MGAGFDCSEHLELLRAMDIIVRHVADEGAQELWFENVPEGAEEDDSRCIASDAELYQWAVTDFLTIMRDPTNGGLCVRGCVLDLQGGADGR